MAAVRSSPTVRRRRLAMELRRLREAAGLTCEDAGRALDNSGAKISRMETGRVGIRARDVRDLLEVYGVTDEAERETLLTLARESRQKGWWHTYGRALPPWFEVYVGLEAAATSISAYEVQVVPGLLQTEAYARAVLRAGRVVQANQDLDQQVTLRMDRQKILTGEDVTDLWAILDEGVLRRQVGGTEVMREQLRHLVTMGELPNVTIQVLPFTAGAHTGTDGAFALLDFDKRHADLDVVYLEHLTGSLYLEHADEVKRYTVHFHHLRASALSRDDSSALIAAAAEEA